MIGQAADRPGTLRLPLVARGATFDWMSHGRGGLDRNLVNVAPSPLLSHPFELRESGRVVRIRLTFNVEQSIDRLEVQEGDDEVVITAWIGWKPGAVHLRNPKVTAAGIVTMFQNVALSEPVGERRLVDGGRLF